MKVLQHKIIQAFKATELLIDNDHLPNDVLWKIYSLRRLLEPSVEFQEMRENYIRDKYAGFVNEKGELASSKHNEYINELRTLGMMEVKLDFDHKEYIRYDPDYKLTIREIEALEDFIDFDLERVCKTGE